MRRVPVTMVMPDMVLAKDIWGRDGMLLAKGTENLQNYTKKLILNGIAAIYVEDGLTEDIESEETVRENTRIKCSEILDKTIDEANITGAVNLDNLDVVVNTLIKEMFDNPNVLLSLSDISTSSNVTLQHSIDAAIYSLFISKLRNYNEMQTEIMCKGALLHDIGKIALDQKILYKNGFLNLEERKHIECHTTWGYRILEEDGWMESPAREIALLHHERLDGSGYPYGLRDRDIPAMSKIVAIADVYDALTSERCYKPAMSNDKAIEILEEDARQGKLDCELVDSFVSKLAVYPNGIVVLLSNGEPAIVKCQNSDDTRRPIVRIINFKDKTAFAKRDCDLTEEKNLKIVKANIKVSDLPDDIKRQFA